MKERPGDTMAQNDKKPGSPKKQEILQQSQSSRPDQDQYSGQEGTNPSGNQDQFSIDGIEGQYGSSRDQPGPADSEELYKTSSQRSDSSRGQKPLEQRENKRADS